MSKSEIHLQKDAHSHCNKYNTNDYNFHFNIGPIYNLDYTLTVIKYYLISCN